MEANHFARSRVARPGMRSRSAIIHTPRRPMPSLHSSMGRSCTFMPLAWMRSMASMSSMSFGVRAKSLYWNEEAQVSCHTVGTTVTHVAPARAIASISAFASTEPK